AARKLLRSLCEFASEIDLEDEISGALESVDPCMDFSLDFTCPACTHCWNVTLDVAAYLWEEIEVLACRLLDEVHVLARSYHWEERQILQLSESRRRAYL